MMNDEKEMLIKKGKSGGYFCKQESNGACCIESQKAICNPLKKVRAKITEMEASLSQTTNGEMKVHLVIEKVGQGSAYVLAVMTDEKAANGLASRLDENNCEPDTKYIVTERELNDTVGLNL